VPDPVLRLLHITDTHLHADPAGRLRGVNTYRTLGAVLDCAAANLRRPDAVLVTGDIAQDETEAAYQHFARLIARIDAPVWCLPGNHDAPDFMARALARPPLHYQGTLHRPPWCVILLNSFLAGEHGGRLDAAELERLDMMLARHREDHVLLAVHHPPLPVGSRWLDELGLKNSAELLQIVERAPQVRAVLAGHVHQAVDVVRDGVRFLTTPSTCFQFLPQSDAFAVDRRPPGFRWLDLHADGSLKTEVVWLEADAQTDPRRQAPALM
jgi:Icc protein